MPWKSKIVKINKLAERKELSLSPRPEGRNKKFQAFFDLKKEKPSKRRTKQILKSDPFSRLQHAGL